MMFLKGKQLDRCGKEDEAESVDLLEYYQQHSEVTLLQDVDDLITAHTLKECQQATKEKRPNCAPVRTEKRILVDSEMIGKYQTISPGTLKPVIEKSSQLFDLQTVVTCYGLMYPSLDLKLLSNPEFLRNLPASTSPALGLLEFLEGPKQQEYHSDGSHAPREEV
ncbi:hypothetical protein STEG23_020274, partial [Scotinomys teguina]